MTLRVEQGKGRKDRYAMLLPVLLERLRAWWRLAHAQGKMLPGGWLFPGMNPVDRWFEIDARGTCPHCGTPIARRFGAFRGGFGRRRIPVRLAS